MNNSTENGFKMTVKEIKEFCVPEVDKKFVAFGAYTVINKVLNTGQFSPVYISGDPGNGKTLSVAQACAMNKKVMIPVNITNETAEEDLIGNYVLIDGDMKWQDGPAITAMKQGAVLLLDEIDQATSKILCLQTILQSYNYFIKKTQEFVQAKPGFMIVATANTKGDGENSDRFIGANLLHEAFLDRFPIIIEQDYPTPEIEQKILMEHTKDQRFAKRLIKWAGAQRLTVKEGMTSTPITTRRLVQICNNHNIFGNEKDSIRYAINRFPAVDRDNLLELYDSCVPDDEIKEEDKPQPKAQENSEWIPF